MYKTDIKTLWDGKTPRPNWAGTGTIDYACVRRMLSFSDVRLRMAQNQQFGLQKCACNVEEDSRGPYRGIPRPKTIKAIVVPVSTVGRTTPDVCDRDLGYTSLHRGHLLALSLGGLNVPENMVPQPGIMNTEVRRLEKAEISQLHWRELELFVQYCALLGLNDGEQPVPGELVSIYPSGDGKASFYTFAPGSQTPRNNPHTLPSPTTKQYKKNEVAAPAFTVTVNMKLEYPQRGAWPRENTVSVSIQNQQLASKTYKWDNNIGDLNQEADYMNWPLLKAKKRKAEDEIQQEYVKRLRSFTPTMADEVEDQMELVGDEMELVDD
jgi:hypothetical protein